MLYPLSYRGAPPMSRDVNTLVRVWVKARRSKFTVKTMNPLQMKRDRPSERGGLSDISPLVQKIRQREGVPSQRKHGVHSAHRR